MVFNFQTQNLLVLLREANSKAEMQAIVSSQIMNINELSSEEFIRDLHFIKDGLNGRWISDTSSDVRYEYYSRLQKSINGIMR